MISWRRARSISKSGSRSRKTFFWAGKYSPDMNDRETLRTDLNVFADFKPRLPESFRSEPYLFWAISSPICSAACAGRMSRVQLTGGDTMNYWINDFRPALLETLKQWDFLLINDSEARLLSGEHNLRRAAAKIMEMGPHTLVIKRGEYGAILFRRHEHFMVPGYLLEDVFDPTVRAIPSPAGSSAIWPAAASRPMTAISISANCAAP